MMIMILIMWIWMIRIRMLMAQVRACVHVCLSCRQLLHKQTCSSDGVLCILLNKHGNMTVVARCR